MYSLTTPWSLIIIIIIIIVVVVIIIKFGLLFLKLLVFELRLGISETSGYSALVPHANTIPLPDLRQLIMTFVGMLTYSRPDMFF
jgi:hypothetical protein